MKGSSRAAAFDAAVVIVLLLFGAWLWSFDEAGGPSMLPDDAPSWAVFPDYLLAGPDAGAWASNATALHLDRAVDLDAHRLPTMPRVIAALMAVIPDVALAGHLWNHLLHLALPLVVYALGAALMGRGAAVGAAFAVAMYPPLLLSSFRFGIDPTVATLLPAALLAAVAAGRWWWSAPLAGGVVAMAACSHLTTLGIPVPALLLALFLGRPGWRRWASMLGLAAGTAGAAWLLFHEYPVLEARIFEESLAEGINPVAHSSGIEGRQASSAEALGVLRSGAAAAADHVMTWLAENARPSWLGWYPFLVLPWLGLLGLGLGGGTGWRRVLGGLGGGVPLALALAPTVAFAAANAPDRYTENFYPLGVLLLFRGLAVLGAGVDAVVPRFWARWPGGLVALALSSAAATGLWDGARIGERVRLAPLREDVAAWRLGKLIGESFPAGGGASCTEREAVAYAGRSYCPATVCPSPAFPIGEPCLAVLRRECSGEGPIPYVVVVKRERDDRSEARKTLDAWVEAAYPLVGTLDDDMYAARIYALPRD